jgi:hypothetical protein
MNAVPLHTAINIIQNYIHARKGIIIDINLVFPKDEEKFIKALNIACAYFNIQF